jgi:membrane protein implicated in regulation of membrane protease activity
MWCHLLLGIPVIGLGVFFMLPFVTALVLYLVVVLISAGLYYKIMESRNAQVITSGEKLVGEVMLTNADGAVHWQGEWWTAEPCLPNQRVRIVALRGLRLLVEPTHEQTNHLIVKQG